MKRLEKYFIKTSELFLNEQEGKFYPFSAVQNSSSEIQMITPHYEKDNPKSEFLIQQFKEFGENQILENKIEKIGICFDINLKMNDEIKSAIQIEFLSLENGEIKKEIKTYFYEKLNGKYKIEKTAHNPV